ncbi:MAG: hypothetical protein AAGG01_09380, partial [Planctomycetota bacterium]
LNANETAEVTLVVQPGTMLTVELNEVRNASKRTFFSVSDASGTTVTGASLREAKSAVVGPLLKGDYRIRVSGKGGAAVVTQDVSVDGQPEQTTTLTIE